MIHRYLPVLLVLLVLPMVRTSVLYGEEAPEDLFFAEIPTVVTPSRMPQKPWHAPSSVTVITAQDIETWGARSMAEVLRRVPGLDVIQYGVTHTAAPRGMANTRRISNVLYLIDGIPVNDPILSAFDIGIDFPLELVKQIEVVRGPGSSLYGANALSGVVNVITRRARDLPGTELRNRVGPDTSAELSVVHGQPSMGTSWIGGFRLHTTDGREANAVNENDWLRDRDFFFSAARGRGEVFLFSSRSDQGRPLEEWDADAEDWIDNRDLYLRSSYRFYERETGTLQLQLYANHKDGSFPGGCPDGTLPSLCTRPDRIPFETTREGINLQWIRSPNARRTIVAGLEYANKEGDWLDIDGKRSSQERSIYFQEERHLGARWHLTIGSRLDEDSIFGSFLSPRLSARRDLDDRRHLRFSTSRSFRSPNYSEQFITSQVGINPLLGLPIRIYGNPDLDPEENLSYEIAYGHRMSRRFHYELSLFQNRSQNRIGVDQINYFIVGFPPTAIGLNVVNEGKLMTRGVELDLAGEASKRLHWSANYAFQRAFDRDNDVDLAYAPKHKFNLILDQKLPRRWNLTLMSRSLSQRLTESSVDKLGGFTVFDARLARTLPSGARIALAGYNLGDKSYYEARGFPMPRRTVSFELRLRF